MSGSMYFRLAADNIKKNAKNYVPFIITSVITAAMFYIINSLAGNEKLVNLSGGDAIKTVLNLGKGVTAIFAVIFLFYTNSFLMKRRKKEFGLWSILGMEKKHIAKVVLIETLYIVLITISFGLIFGIMLDKLMFLLIAKLIGRTVVLGFYISFEGMLATAALIGIIYLLIFLNSLRQITFAKPIELLKGGNTGEKEPKAKWLAALLGLICLGVGYYLAVSITNPVAALSVFFIAVILVIAGTYLLFITGSIALLKLLKKNKRYYYKTKHFISVSGMMYRMKQNAVGLANICILATMVLVMISSTSSLIIGVEDVIKSRYPYDYQIYNIIPAETETEQIKEIRNRQFGNVETLINDKGMVLKDKVEYTYLNVVIEKSEGELNFKNVDYSNIALNDIYNLSIMTVDDYNSSYGKTLSLGDDEIYIHSSDDIADSKTIKIAGNAYTVKDRIKKFSERGDANANIVDTINILVKDDTELDRIYQEQKKVYNEGYSVKQTYMGFDVTLEDGNDVSESDKMKLGSLISETLGEEEDFHGYAETKAGADEDFRNDFGGIFFIAIFLGLLFTMAAILIIYYKQISEGYDDKKRFEIMQKVGMTHEEVKSSISSQILTVFFLPLITAAVHVAFAFPLINKILSLMNLYNTKLYLLCSAVSLLVFAAIYSIVYALTAREYFKIVKR